MDRPRRDRGETVETAWKDETKFETFWFKSIHR